MVVSYGINHTVSNTNFMFMLYIFLWFDIRLATENKYNMGKNEINKNAQLVKPVQNSQDDIWSSSLTCTDFWLNIFFRDVVTHASIRPLMHISIHLPTHPPIHTLTPIPPFEFEPVCDGSNILSVSEWYNTNKKIRIYCPCSYRLISLFISQTRRTLCQRFSPIHRLLIRTTTSCLRMWTAFSSDRIST